MLREDWNVELSGAFYYCNCLSVDVGNERCMNCRNKSQIQKSRGGYSQMGVRSPERGYDSVRGRNLHTDGIMDSSETYFADGFISLPPLRQEWQADLCYSN